VLEAQAEVRRTIARDLHDGPVQTLTAMIVELELLRRAGVRDAGEDVTINRLTDSARSVMSELRSMLYEYRAESDRDTDLLAGIREVVQRFTTITAIRVEIAAPATPISVPRAKSVELRRIVGEALNNVARHAHASVVQLTIQVVERTLVVTVADNGRGMQPLLAAPGIGIKGMRERAAVIGARLTIDSTDQAGTRVRLGLPLEHCRDD
jgi:signal transduction histidine kinase